MLNGWRRNARAEMPTEPLGTARGKRGARECPPQCSPAQPRQREPWSQRGLTSGDNPWQLGATECWDAGLDKSPPVPDLLAKAAEDVPLG